MVANLTKAKDDGHTERLRRAAESAHRGRDALVLAGDEDTGAFNAYMEARRLPQATEEERAAREAAMLEGLKSAVEVPLRTACLSLEAMEAAAAVVKCGNPASVTDGLVGLQLGYAGVRGGAWNALINIKDISDAAFSAETKKRCEDLVGKAKTLLEGATAMGEAGLP
jgi:glutamate formiminotransferase/formiminotetrahydrofolate cyclodeaminase